MLAWYALAVLGLSGQVRFFCQDETRIGLKTISGRKITAKGVKPKGKVQWQFKATYLYGVVEPVTGEHFFYEFTHLNSDCFQVFLNLVSEQYKDCILNIILMFQPAHAPETNPYAFGGAKPYERVWQHFKLGLRWNLPKDLNELRLLMRARLEAMTQAVIASIVAWHSILQALSVAGI